jgi:hypothetical protein
MTYSQTDLELRKHLEEQLEFLKASADAFDAGNTSEAKRIAAVLRVLLHDKGRSQSLLAQLGIKETSLFIDSADPPEAGSVVSHHGLVAIEMSDSGPARALARLDLPRAPTYPRVPFSEWWEATVFIDRRQGRLSRRTLVLAMAEQDGGAHIDPTLEETYADLSRRNSMDWQTVLPNGEREPIDGMERIAVRQICHEVLKTLQPRYAKPTQARSGSLAFGAFSIVDITEEVEGRKKAAQHEARKKHLSRNATCPCGSGRRYKHCCG